MTVLFNDTTFAGQHVLISGGTGGIGGALARGFRDHGARVTATGSSSKRVAVAADDPANAGIRFVRLDVRNSQDVSTFMAEATELSVLVNAAGISRPKHEFTDTDATDVIEVNLTSLLRMCTAAHSALLARRGCIINVASMLSFLADPDLPAYGASKTGVLGLTRALAHAYGADGIRVNAVAPGYHVTDMTRGAWSDPVRSDAIAQRAALKRWGTTYDLVGPTLFLASPAAAFVTGVTLPVDGGYVVSNVLP